MEGYEIKFKIYAESEEEAQEAQLSIIRFISQNAQNGLAVTGKKISEAFASWNKNIFIRNQVINYLK